jgi:hypothetical protein
MAHRSLLDYGTQAAESLRSVVTEILRPKDLDDPGLASAHYPAKALAPFDNLPGILQPAGNQFARRLFHGCLKVRLT